MTTTLQTIRKRKQERRTLLRRELLKVKQQLIGMGALRIILFGSFVQERPRRWSDLDLICIMPSAMSGREWMRKIQEGIDRDVSCDIIAYTAEELEQATAVSRFLRHVLATGKTIYEKHSSQ